MNHLLSRAFGKITSFSYPRASNAIFLFHFLFIFHLHEIGFQWNEVIVTCKYHEMYAYEISIRMQICVAQSRINKIWGLARIFQSCRNCLAWKIFIDSYSEFRRYRRHEDFYWTVMLPEGKIWLIKENRLVDFKITSVSRCSILWLNCNESLGI